MKTNTRKKYRVREYSPLWWAGFISATAGLYGFVWLAIAAMKVSQF